MYNILNFLPPTDIEGPRFWLVYLRDVIKIRQNPTLQMLETFIMVTKYYCYHEKDCAEKLTFFAVKPYDSWPWNLHVTKMATWLHLGFVTAVLFQTHTVALMPLWVTVYSFNGFCHHRNFTICTAEATKQEMILWPERCESVNDGAPRQTKCHEQLNSKFLSGLTMWIMLNKIKVESKQIWPVHTVKTKNVLP